MSRSVSTHRHSVETVYLHPEFERENEFEREIELAWEDFMQDLQENVLPEIFPSLTECDRWLDREDHVIAENGRCEISVSEYCGLVAVCLAPKDPDNALDVAWCERCSSSFRKKMHKFFPDSSLNSFGRASNGEQFFSKIGKTPSESCITSKEGVLW